jgi:hypothetical protein
MKLHCITFADGIHEKYKRAALKLCDMIVKSQIFSTMKVYTVEDLLQDKEFHERHMGFIQQNRRGFGYWIWKPYIVWKRLQEVEEGDIVLYLDACTTFNNEGKARFLDYLNLLLSSPQKCFFLEMAKGLTLRKYTKMDCVKQLDAEALLDLPVLVAGILMMANTSYNRQMIKYIYDTCSEYHLVDDSPSTLTNDPTFKEHRHDQSIISIIFRKLAPSSIFELEDEFYFYKREAEGAKYPFWIQSNEY